MQNLEIFPIEYRQLVAEADSLKFRDEVLAKKKYLEAVKFLALRCTENNPDKYIFEKEAQRVFEISKGIEKSYKVKERLKDSTVWVNENKEAIDSKRKIGMQDVFGLEKLKEEILLKIVLPLRRPDIVKKFKRKSKTGILMYGPPGCGKSLIAEAISNDLGIPFFHVKASDIKSKWVGESEKNISRLFEEARANQPSIVFIDEFESIGRSREGQNHSAEKNLVSQFLSEMDGLGNKEDNIIFIAATNEPWNIDNALLRSGRFSSKIFVNIPDKPARFEILVNELKNKPVDGALDIKKIVQATKGYSSADVVALCESASDFALLRYMNEGYAQICEKDLLKAIEKIKPVTKSWFNNAIRQIKERGLDEEFVEIRQGEGVE